MLFVMAGIVVDSSCRNNFFFIECFRNGWLNNLRNKPYIHIIKIPNIAAVNNTGHFVFQYL